MPLAQHIYQALPTFFQNIAISAYGIPWHYRRFGGIFSQELKGYKEREHLNGQQFIDYQTTTLRRLLMHAHNTVPYYQRIFKSRAITISKLQQFELDDLKKLPLLEKNDLRKLGTSDLISNKPESGGHFFASSGSTGTPTQILFSNSMHQRWSAGFEARIRHWAGVSLKDPRGTIGGRRVVPNGLARSPFYRYNLIERQTYFSAYHISAMHAPDYLEGIRRHHVNYMTGYAMSNYFLARFFEEARLDAPPMKAVLPSSEKLTPEMRATFQRVYNCKSFDAWSGVEACGLISECEYGCLHSSPDMAILEFIDPETGRPAKAGQLAEVVCTGLLNFDQPLIRYRIGDLMRYSDTTCLCGRAMPVIQEIEGRMEDTLIGSDGRKMVRFHGIFLGINRIIEGQVIQQDIMHFLIKLVTATPLTKDEKLIIRDRMTSQLGPINIDIEEVDQIPRGQNGKFKAVISNVIKH